MTRFEQRNSDIGSDHTANKATNTEPLSLFQIFNSFNQCDQIWVNKVSNSWTFKIILFDIKLVLWNVSKLDFWLWFGSYFLGKLPRTVWLNNYLFCAKLLYACYWLKPAQGPKHYLLISSYDLSMNKYHWFMSDSWSPEPWTAPRWCSWRRATATRPSTAIPETEKRQNPEKNQRRSSRGRSRWPHFRSHSSR